MDIFVLFVMKLEIFMNPSKSQDGIHFHPFVSSSRSPSSFEENIQIINYGSRGEKIFSCVDMDRASEGVKGNKGTFIKV